MARVPLGAPVTNKTNNSEKRSGLVPAGEGEGGAWVQRAAPGQAPSTVLSTCSRAHVGPEPSGVQWA